MAKLFLSPFRKCGFVLRIGNLLLDFTINLYFKRSAVIIIKTNFILLVYRFFRIELRTVSDLVFDDVHFKIRRFPTYRFGPVQWQNHFFATREPVARIHDNIAQRPGPAE